MYIVIICQRHIPVQIDKNMILFNMILFGIHVTRYVPGISIGKVYTLYVPIWNPITLPGFGKMVQTRLYHVKTCMYIDIDINVCMYIRVYRLFEKNLLRKLPPCQDHISDVCTAMSSLVQ